MTKIYLWGSIGVLTLIFALPAFSLTVKSGVGTPNLEGWCQIDWRLGTIVGHGGITPQGLFLSSAITPPIPSYEIDLRFVAGRTKLLFLFESPISAGKLLLYLNQEVANILHVPAQGAWWLELEDYPSSGTLRLELGPCTDTLLIKGIYYPCPAPCPSCLPWFVAGALMGALFVWLILR